MKTIFRTIGFCEAISFIYLLLVAMPMKYYYGDLGATRIPGMLHGLLFVAYVGIATVVSDLHKWPKKQLWMAYLAAILPLGVLVFDAKYLLNKK